MSKSILIAYFSASGVTRRVAEELASACGGDLYEIAPAIPYTTADLNWRDPESRSSKEMKGKAEYPELKDVDADVEGHSVVFLGFPIWWYTAPTIVRRFLESYDFSGKKIVLFATSGGSGFGKTAEDLRRAVKGDAQIVAGRILNGRHSALELKTWIQSCL